ncbi:unnamed protein product [Rotaria socialis]|uniref:PLAC8 family protein n=1 Tax=Rotaria socialis TaxID=392032 RepID=A0A817X3M8_9BILA|nr:unnamed protein product [Rotaria socialis]CAF3363232.1 unnamed protein product [Rotaria socialis]CAF3618921.1 unnamed protein product [Rotaria socialis]CAF3733256.1 unnamed protein product [Rotaria socialis]CAF3770268.1 unnamed protein product [Rotaria socialis]
MSEIEEWNERLFGCCDDWGICCYGFWCGPCLFSSNAKRLDGSNWCVNCCVFCTLGQVYQSWLLQYFKRQKLRKIYRLKEDRMCGDAPATLCCSSCALCQEAREMKARDHYPGKGEERAKLYTTTEQPTASQPRYVGQAPQYIYDTRAF